MNWINSRLDEMSDFVKTNIPHKTDNKKGEQVLFSEQLPSQATSNPRNLGATSSQMHNLNHVHVNENTMETTLDMLSLRGGKDLLDPYKDHPFR